MASPITMGMKKLPIPAAYYIKPRGAVKGEIIVNKKITILDGAQGTRLWQLAAEQGFDREPVWKYNITHPEIVAQVCREYAEAGSEIICANTFGANRLSVEKENGFTVPQVVEAAVGIARDALAGTGVQTALDIGPLSVLMEPYGDLEEDEAEEIFAEMLAAGASAGAELIFFETFLDMEMMRVGVQAAQTLPRAIPVVCSMSFEKSGRTMMGNSVEDVAELLAPMGVAGLGMNCSLGPDLSLPMIRRFADCTDLPLFFKPNAGMPSTAPDGTTVYDLGAEQFAAEVAPVLEIPNLRWLGGCCGTDAAYIRQLKAMVR